MTVSLCIIAYNEEAALPGLLTQVREQTFSHKLTELILVDSASNDDTKKIMTDFSRRYREEFMDIRVIDNPKKSQAAGWNAAISNALGDVIIRVDAHAEIPEDFLSESMNLIEQGEDVCGGGRPSKLDEPTAFKEMLFLAESSMFGSSIAGYRRKTEEKRYVDSLFHGAYRREVFAKVGGFNEALGRTEDNEMHYRIRKAGYKICQGSRIVSYQHVRGSLGSMLRQKYGNGKWIGLTAGVCYQCLSSFHFVPFMFVLMLICSLTVFIGGIVFGLFWMMIPFMLLMGAYFAADLLMTAAAVIGAKKKHPVQLLLPIVFFLLHFSYGWGTMIGLISLPFWKHKLDGSAQKEIERVKQCVIDNTTTKAAEVD